VTKTAGPRNVKVKIALNGTITEKDIIDYNVRQYKRSRTTKSLLWVLWAVCVAVGLISVLSDPSAMPEDDTAGFYVILVFVLIILPIPLVIALKFFMPTIVRWSVKVMMKKDHINESIGSYRIELLANTIRDTINSEATTEVPYGHIRSVEFDKSRLYIYVGGARAFIVPFSAFKDESEKQRFLDIIHCKAPATAQTMFKQYVNSDNSRHGSSDHNSRTEPEDDL